MDRPTAEVIRQAMEEYRDRRIHRRTSMREVKPLRLGRVLNRAELGQDILEEMLDDLRA